MSAQFQVYYANPNGGFWLPVTDWNGASQAFQGAASYAPGGDQTVYLVAQGQPPATVGYSRRVPGDDNRQIAFVYRIGAQVPQGQVTSASQLPRLVGEVQQAAGWGGRYVIAANDSRDGSWVFYLDNQRQP